MKASRAIILAVSSCAALALFLSGAFAQGEKWWEAEKKEETPLVYKEPITRDGKEAGSMHFNWAADEMVVEGIGLASPSPELTPAQKEWRAIRAARTVAHLNLLMATDRIFLTSETVVDMGELKSQIIKEAVEGYVDRVVEVGKPQVEHLQDGSVVAHVWVKRNIYSSTGAGQKSIFYPINRFESEQRAKEPIVDRRMPDKVPPASKTKPYTGLIVDCRGKKARPSITPRIVDEQKREIYGSLKVERNYLLSHGLAGYAADPESALKLQKDRIGENPLMVEAVDVSGPQKDVAVVDGLAADKIMVANKLTKFLNECKVVFVLD